MIIQISGFFSLPVSLDVDSRNFLLLFIFSNFVLVFFKNIISPKNHSFLFAININWLQLPVDVFRVRFRWWLYIWHCRVQINSVLIFTSNKRDTMILLRLYISIELWESTNSCTDLCTKEYFISKVFIYYNQLPNIMKIQ